MRVEGTLLVSLEGTVVFADASGSGIASPLGREIKFCVLGFDMMRDAKRASQQNTHRQNVSR